MLAYLLTILVMLITATSFRAWLALVRSIGNSHGMSPCAMAVLYGQLNSGVVG